MFKTFRAKLNTIIIVELLFNLALYLQFYIASAFALVAYSKNLDSTKSATNQLSIIIAMVLGFFVCKCAKFIMKLTSENFVELLKTLLFMRVLDVVRNMTSNAVFSHKDTRSIVLYFIVSAFILYLIKAAYSEFDNKMFASKYFKKRVINYDYVNRMNEEFFDDLKHANQPDAKMKLLSEKIINPEYKEYATLTDVLLLTRTFTDRKGTNENGAAAKIEIKFYNLKSSKSLALVTSEFV